MNPCLFCEKSYAEIEELVLHMTSEHRGVSSEKLKYASDSLATIKQLGDSWSDSPGRSFECPDCYDVFSSSEKLNSHRKKTHNLQYTEEASIKAKEFEKYAEDNPPTCEKCNLKYMAMIVCKMDGKTITACLDCYENHYGSNMLQKLTLGTPNDIVEKIRKPV